MANHQFIAFTTNYLKVLSIACLIPPGTLLHTWFKGDSIITKFYVIGSIIGFVASMGFFYLAAIILKRYYSYDE